MGFWRNRSLGALFLALAVFAGRAEARPEVEPPSLVLHGVPFSLTVSDPELGPGETLDVNLQVGEKIHSITLTGEAPQQLDELRLKSGEGVQLQWQEGIHSVPVHTLPGWSSLLPPLVAILLAIAFRQVIIALLVGVWLGAVLVLNTDPFTGLLRTFDTYITGSLSNSDNVSILVFSFLLGGMLGVIQRVGGTKGIVTLVSPHARTPRSGQLTTWIMGLLIFFDDYANSLLVGNTMRPLTDRLRISREKLAYIVDSTAAPVASIAVISTWIGVEVGLIQGAFSELGLERDAFAAFLGSLPYRFYPIFALAFGFMIAFSGRDFGPMLRAERRARSTGKLLREGAVPLADFEGESLSPPANKPVRWVNAAVPVLVVVGCVLVFIYLGGRRAAVAAGGPLDLKTIVGSADSYAALLWASALGSVTAIVLAVVQRILSLNQAVLAWVQGMKSIMMAAIILALAWSIGTITGEMGTSGYLVHLLGDTLNPRLVPALVFVLAGLTSFATGSSWSTMGILIPLVIPLAHTIAPGNEVILFGTISSVLAGAVWGDHCSPISDTTVLSSMASSCDHVDHVNTQLPYAMVVGVIGLLVGDVATAFGLPFWLSWILGLGLLAAVLRGFGRKSAVETGLEAAPGEV